jgi:DNA-binding NtrC family response regulator
LYSDVVGIGPAKRRSTQGGTADLGGDLTEAASTTLARYDWPENVRELRETNRSAVGLSHGGAIDVTSLPQAVRRGTSVSSVRAMKI